MAAKRDEDRRMEPYCNVNCGINELKTQVSDMHKVIIGDGKEPGLAEMVRTHNKFIDTLQKWYAVVVTTITVGAVGFCGWLIYFAFANGWKP